MRTLREKLNLGSYEDWRNQGRGLAYLYQRIFFYVGIAKTEILKPLGYWNETVLILTFLSVRFQVNPSVVSILITYAVVTGVTAIIGKLLVVSGVFRYNTSLTSQQNPELMKVLEELEGIKLSIQELKHPPRPPNEVNTKSDLG